MNLVYAYTRENAIEDGVQFKCDLANEAGFTIPVFVTKGVYDLIKESLSYGLNDYDGVLWDIFTILRLEIKKSTTTDFLEFKVYINWQNDKPKLFRFFAEIGALDINKPEPAITIMLPEEN